MDNTNWLRQTPDKPLFPDLLWSRPEQKAAAGKLLIIGGNLHGFTAPAGAFAAAEKAGIGTARIVLPDKLQKTVSKLFPEAEYAPSTPVGSFSRQALADLLERADWADGVLLAGDFGKNSETAILLESFLEKFKGQVTLSGDSLDYFLTASFNTLERENTAIIADFRRLQSLAKHQQPQSALRHSMGLYELVKALGEWSKDTEAALATYHEDNVTIAYRGKVSTTPVKSANLSDVAAYLSVWLLQNPKKPFEAMSSSVSSLS